VNDATYGVYEGVAFIVQFDQHRVWSSSLVGVLKRNQKNGQDSRRKDRYNGVPL